MSEDITQLKKQAGQFAAQFVESGMVVGLGHGSTAIWATRKIAERIHSGELQNVLAIPCSLAVEKDARELNIPMTDFSQHIAVDLTIDGADEVDPNFQLIKGGGGALLREKIVAQASAREIIVVDESKLSSALCKNFALPIEVVPFGYQSQMRTLEAMGAEIKLRLNDDDATFKTDQGNYILDCRFPPMANPHEISQKLNSLAMVVEHGLFLDIATDLVIARPDGVEHQVK